MPQFLKSDAIKLLESGIEMYLLGLFGFTLPKTKPTRYDNSRHAPIIGLMGASAELLIKACVVQANDISSVYESGKTGGRYKLGSEVLKEFHQALNNKDIKYAFLSEILENEEISGELDNLLSKFKLLQDSRAKGLHAGIGYSYDTTNIIINEVYAFLNILRQCKKLKPYIKNIPVPLEPIKDREALLEDLSRRSKKSTKKDDQISSLIGMYLVLPYIPDYKPDWIEALESVTIVPPQSKDIHYLIRSLSEAHSIYLLKNRGGLDGVPVKVEPNNPDAIPVNMPFLKRELRSIPELFYADNTNANSRLKESRLDLPIEDFILDIYSLGIDESKIIVPPATMLPSQQTWAFIASAINTQGRPWPFWFFVRKCDELQKLKRTLNSITPFSRKQYRNRIPSIISGIDAIENDSIIAIKKVLGYEKAKFFDEFILRCKNYITSEPQIITTDYLKKNPISDHVALTISLLKQRSITGSVAIEKILTEGTITDFDLNIIKKLIPHCYKFSERKGLIAVINSTQLQSHHSEARKILSFVDLIVHGPKIDGINREDYI